MVLVSHSLCGFISRLDQCVPKRVASFLFFWLLNPQYFKNKTTNYCQHISKCHRRAKENYCFPNVYFLASGDDAVLVTPMSDDEDASDTEPGTSTEELRRQAAASLGLTTGGGARDRSNVTSQASARSGKRPGEATEAPQAKRATGVHTVRYRPGVTVSFPRPQLRPDLLPGLQDTEQ